MRNRVRGSTPAAVENRMVKERTTSIVSGEEVDTRSLQQVADQMKLIIRRGLDEEGHTFGVWNEIYDLRFAEKDHTS